MAVESSGAPRFGAHRAPWGDDGVRWPALVEAVTTDVLVVGGGVTGLTTALELLDRGLSVVVLEGDAVGTGSTGRSTGKVTSQHGICYTDLEAEHGREVALAYAQANETAVHRVAELAARHAPDCRPERVAAHVHTTSVQEAERLQREARAAAALGLPASLTSEAPVPHEVAAAVRFDDQLQLDPRRYVQGLAAAVDGGGGRIHDGSRVRSVRRRRGGLTATTDTAEVRARHVVLATLSPTVDPPLTFARTEPSRSYGIAAEVDGEVADDPSITASDPMRSTRRLTDPDGRELLVVVGAGHVTGRDHDPVPHLEALRAYADRHWGGCVVRAHWSAQDHRSVDGLPLIGATRLHPRLLVATGMRKWGLTIGTAAARLLADAITGERSTSPFAPGRLPRPSSWPKLVALNLGNGLRLVRDRVPRSRPTPPAPGDGVVLHRPVGAVAVCTLRDGTRHAVSASCTHLGCVVDWNTVESSWDCPCHGSRFAADGRVLVGPAHRPLRPAADPFDDRAQ